MNALQLDALQLSPDLIRRVALGLDQPLDIAAEFGIDEPTFRWLEQQDWFVNHVLTARETMKAGGEIRIERLRHIYDMVMESTAQEAMTTAVPFNQKLAFLDHLSVNGNIKPKPDMQVGGAGAASIIINIGDRAVVAPVGPEVHTIEGKATRIGNPITLKFRSTDNAELGAGEVYEDA